MRQDHEPPSATRLWGWRYHHTGIPTRRPRDGERYLPRFKMYVSGFPDSPYGVVWMRFEPGSPIPELVQAVPHVAFEVKDIDEALKGKEVLSAPGTPSAGVRAAMIVDNGCPIELIEFTKTTRHGVRGRRRAQPQRSTDTGVVGGRQATSLARVVRQGHD